MKTLVIKKKSESGKGWEEGPNLLMLVAYRGMVSRMGSKTAQSGLWQAWFSLE